MAGYLNALHLVATSRRCTIRLTEGELVLESGLRLCGGVRRDGPETVAVPSDIHEVVLRWNAFGFARAGEGNVVPVETIVSVAGKFAKLAGTLENGPGGEAHLTYGDSRLLVRDEGTFPFELLRERPVS